MAGVTTDVAEGAECSGERKGETVSERLGPMTAKGCVILDANGNPVGSTSRPELSKALAAAYNAVAELTELANERWKQWDGTSSCEYHDGYETARDLMGQQITKIIGGATAKEAREWLENSRAQPIPARDQEHDGHDGHL